MRQADQGGGLKHARTEDSRLEGSQPVRSEGDAHMENRLNRAPRAQALRRRVRWLTVVIVLGLLVAGVTAVPLQAELDWLVGLAKRWQEAGGAIPADAVTYLAKVRDGVASAYGAYPFLAYGTDWLAFAHIALAMIFWGAWKDPVGRRWLFSTGIVICWSLMAWALALGALRGIPLAWRFMDCGFGAVALVPLWLCRRWTNAIAEMEQGATHRQPE